ncbi:phospholipid-binding lipoprotein MlaA [uncultured Gammaproteobacteria bacterium]
MTPVSGRTSGWTFAFCGVAAVALIIAVAARPAYAGGDPLEPFNRAAYTLNNYFARGLLVPAGAALRLWLPEPVMEAAGNAYSNLIEPEFILTNLLAGHRADAGVSAGRFLINSTLGLVGLFDPAERWFNLQRRETEFGEALCLAGVPPGPYLVLPVVGSTNAVGAGLVGVFVAMEWAVIGVASTFAVVVEQVLELSVGAAGVRHAGEAGEATARDGYLLQRTEFWEYIEGGCRPDRKPLPLGGVQGQGAAPDG